MPKRPTDTTLYLVGTPIGNLEDMTFRAVRVLREADLIAAEDTRKAKVLLRRYDIATPVVSYDEQGSAAKLPRVLDRLRQADVALITEAGMPSLSDPGYSLVRAALAEGIRVEVVPGPSAVTAAVAVSGLPADQFVFLGFLPRRSGPRRKLLSSMVDESRALVFFEAPHRLKTSLGDLADCIGDGRRVAVCRELTKLHEEVFRSTVGEALAHFQQPKGEITIVVEGNRSQGPKYDEEAVRGLLRSFRDQGMTARQAAVRAAQETGVGRREAYRLWLAEARDEAGP